MYGSRHLLDDDRPFALNHRLHEMREIAISRHLLEKPRTSAA
jgi:hypothetical protein